ncbi:hypothetical protein EST62_04710 [Chlorobaculum sp. 24CR]|uniref:hypothetical protein n=1 Tax=Chlorobaculum sp. 24CR TaxID=2508878 RepID=UPI00100BB323|nr:hypothetical protein [Chlorobaculum sp. 24CR]RXK88170.1 hypothetical protein EST62_04710 [Chlorobaculum sp. 24CR]
MERKYEVGGDYFIEEIMAAVFLGFRTAKNPSTVTVHPELIKKIRERFRNKVVGPKRVGDSEVFCGLKVIEDATKEKDYLSVS